MFESVKSMNWDEFLLLLLLLRHSFPVFNKGFSGIYSFTPDLWVL